jgi:hypothetical protein
MCLVLGGWDILSVNQTWQQYGVLVTESSINGKPWFMRDIWMCQRMEIPQFIAILTYWEDEQ